MKSGTAARVVHATVDNRIRVPVGAIPEPILDAVLDALEIPNRERELAMKHYQYGAEDLPKKIVMYGLRGDTLDMPRGFFSDFKAGLESFGLSLELEDRRTAPRRLKLGGKSIKLRPHQIPAVDSILKNRQGILKGPPGCVAGDTMLSFNRAGKSFKMSIEEAHKKFNSVEGAAWVDRGWRKDIPTYCRALVKGQFRQHLVEDIVYSGMKQTLEFTLESGKTLRCTDDHKIKVGMSWVRAGELEIGSRVMVNGQKVARHFDKDGYVIVRAPEGHPRAFHIGGPKRYKHGYVREHILVAEKKYGRPILPHEHIHHKDRDKANNEEDNLEVKTASEHSKTHRRVKNMDGGTAGTGGDIVFLPKWEKVVSIKDAGICKTYDMVMQDPHNNFVANGMVVHNSGKTVSILEAGRRFGSKCLIVVNTKEILNQWIDRIHEHLDPNIEVGKIGDNMFSIGGTWTVAIVNTLHSKKKELIKSGFFKSFGFVCLDECHHATAETYMGVMDLFTAAIRMGASATPKKTGDFTLAQLILGNIFHTTKLEDIPDELDKPVIVKVKTNFNFNFVGTKSRYRRSNYPDLLKSLIADPERNRGIVGAIMSETGHHCLVLTKRHDHIDILIEMLEREHYPYPIMRLTGKEKSAVREEVVETIATHPGVTFSTVADEALDIPRIDRGFLIYPQANDGLIEQQLGRLMRFHPDKADSRVYDFVDPKVPPLRKQWTTRLTKVYKKFKLRVINVPIEEYL